MDTLTSAFIIVPRIDETLCRACRKCVARQACRTRAITIYEAGEPPFIDAARCYGCRACLAACPFGAIVIESERG